MVLEAIISATTARKWPIGIFFMGIVLSSVGLWVAYFLFPDSSSILALMFVVLAMMPVIHKTFTIEEAEEVYKPGFAAGFLARHFSLVKIYAWFFLSLIVSYSFWYVVLPATAPEDCLVAGQKPLSCLTPAKDKVFGEQEKVYSWITGRAVGIEECKDPETRSFWKCAGLIFSTNSFVMGLAVLFSFLYGAGALFIIGWNASIIGLFVGREILDVHWISGVLKAIGYLPHGIFEVGAYFIAAIAGGIISAAISKKKFRTRGFEIIAKDTIMLLVIAYVVLFIGALVEAWLIINQ